MSKKYLLPRFRDALAAHEKELPAATFWRYSNGKLPPPLGPLLLKHPSLAAALAEDVRDLASSQTNEERPTP